MENKNTPEIRFKGFTDAWVQRTLGEVAEILTGGTPKTQVDSYWNPKEIPWMSSGEINKKRLDETENMISTKGLENSSARWIPRDSVLIALAGQGKTRGTVAINNIALTTNQSIAAIVLKKPLHFEFVFQNLGLRYEELRWISSGGDDTRGGLNKQIISDITILSPCVAEQTAIGGFFRTLDDTITLYQRKLDGLKKLKAAYLQQMFPRAGEFVPRVRFTGFTEPWEQRKLGEVAERITRKNKNLESTLPLTISAQYGLIDQTDFFDKQVASRDVSNYYLLKNGEFAYNKSYSNGYPWGAVKRLDKYDMGLLSTLYIVFKVIDVDSEFLVQYYETEYWHTEVSQFAAEGARNHGLLNIATSDLFETKVHLPVNRTEQIAIGNFFLGLDKQITAQMTKVEKIQKLKQAYLQKMFV